MSVIPVDFLTRAGSRMHEPFLERASEVGNRYRSHALGAFLTLRAIDRIADSQGSLSSDALKYQLTAASSYLDELHPQNEEVSHLREILRVAETASARTERRLLWAPMLAFAFWLEQQLRLAESLDTLDTVVRIRGAECDDRLAAHLQRGRVLRLLGKFPDSHAAYTMAGEMANLIGDWRSEMVSRIGRATNLQKTGDLPASVALLKQVLEAAGTSRDQFIEARALHGLAMSMHLMKQVPEAVALALKAHAIYDEPVQRARALSDVGMFLKDLGHYSAAKDAFGLVLETMPTPEIRINTVLELLELSAHVQDRIAFERWRREIESGFDHMPSDEQVDFETKVGTGLISFGNTRDGIKRLTQALVLAESYKLSQRIFEIELLLQELRAGRRPEVTSPREEPRVAAELQESIDSLCALKSGAAAY